MAALERRTAAVELSEPCASCRRPLSEQPPASAGPSGAAGAGLAHRSTMTFTLLTAFPATLCLDFDQRQTPPYNSRRELNEHTSSVCWHSWLELLAHQFLMMVLRMLMCQGGI